VNAHPLLLRALEAAPPETHPPEPFHGGGPQPSFDSQAYAEAAVWLAERIEPHVDPRDRAVFERLLGFARRQLVLGVGDSSHRKAVLSADASSASRVPCKLAHWAVKEVAGWAFREVCRPPFVGAAAQPAAANLGRFLADHAPTSLRDLLVDLDALCLTLEATTVLRARKLIPLAPVQAALWRDHAKGKATAWLLRLTNGSLALLAKSGPRWRLVIGEEDALAAIPTERRERARVAASRAKLAVAPRHPEADKRGKTPRAAQAPKRTRNARLEAAIVESPESPDGYLAYGEWLRERGDPLGELVAVQAALTKRPTNRALKRRERELLMVEEENLGPFAELDPTWAHGFLESLTIDPSPSVYEALLALDAARFLRELYVDLVDARGARENPNEELVAAIAEHGVPRSLRLLALAADSTVGIELGSLRRLYSHFRQLRELRITAATVELGALDLPSLQAFSFDCPATAANLRSLRKAKWPRLTSLSLGCDDSLPLTSLSLLSDALAPLSGLRHLGVTNHALGDVLLRVLIEEHRGLLGRLESLDLSSSCLSDVGAQAIFHNLTAFRQMDSIDLRGNALSAGTGKWLTKALGLPVDV
jgi:uncharacterized protein (TIGR02996 family)